MHNFFTPLMIVSLFSGLTTLWVTMAFTIFSGPVIWTLGSPNYGNPSMASFHSKWYEWNINSTLTSSTLKWFWLRRQKNVWLPETVHYLLNSSLIDWVTLLRLENIVEWMWNESFIEVCVPFDQGSVQHQHHWPGISLVWLCIVDSEGQQLFWSCYCSHSMSVWSIETSPGITLCEVVRLYISALAIPSNMMSSCSDKPVTHTNREHTTREAHFLGDKNCDTTSSRCSWDYGWPKSVGSRQCMKWKKISTCTPLILMLAWVSANH